MEAMPIGMRRIRRRKACNSVELFQRQDCSLPKSSAHCLVSVTPPRAATTKEEGLFLATQSRPLRFQCHPTCHLPRPSEELGRRGRMQHAAVAPLVPADSLTLDRLLGLSGGVEVVGLDPKPLLLAADHAPSVGVAGSLLCERLVSLDLGLEDLLQPDPTAAQATPGQAQLQLPQGSQLHGLPQLLPPQSEPASPAASSRDDAVVPMLPPSPASPRALVPLLTLEHSSPLSPPGRVVTTGSSPAVQRQSPSPAAPSVQDAAWGLPPWVDFPAADTLKPAPVTTNAAALPSVSVQAAGRKRASLLASAQHNTPKLALLLPDFAAALPTVRPSTATATPPLPAAAPPSSATMLSLPPYMVMPAAAAPFSSSPPTRSGAADKETRAEKLARYRAKKARRNFCKTVRYKTRKDYADVRPRIKGRFVTPEEYAAFKAQQGAALQVVPILSKH